MLSAELKTFYFVICSAEDLFTLNSNKFRMVYKVDGNPQLDTCDWSMYSNILKVSRVKAYQISCLFIFTSIYPLARPKRLGCGMYRMKRLLN